MDGDEEVEERAVERVIEKAGIERVSGVEEVSAGEVEEGTAEAAAASRRAMPSVQRIKRSNAVGGPSGREARPGRGRMPRQWRRASRHAAPATETATYRGRLSNTVNDARARPV